MIRIDLGDEVAPGVFEFSIPSLALSGKSRQPLLDACRLIQRAVGATKAAETHAGLYRASRTSPDLHCLVAVGAGTTVSEPAGGRITFSKFQPFDRGTARAAHADITAATEAA